MPTSRIAMYLINVEYGDARTSFISSHCAMDLKTFQDDAFEDVGTDSVELEDNLYRYFQDRRAKKLVDRILAKLGETPFNAETPEEEMYFFLWERLARYGAKLTNVELKIAKAENYFISVENAEEM